MSLFIYMFLGGKRGCLSRRCTAVLLMAVGAACGRTHYFVLYMSLDIFLEANRFICKRLGTYLPLQ